MSIKSIFWYRRDLRLHDNHALFKALQNGGEVMPIFIYDSNIINNLDPGDHRLKFINDQIQIINNKLSEIGKKIYTFFGDPLSVVKSLKSEYDFDSLYFNKDYEPYALERDNKISDYLLERGCSSHSFKDHVIFEENNIVKDDGKPYVVYTPFSRKWLMNFDPSMTKSFDSISLLNNLVDSNSLNISSEDSKIVDNAITPIKYNLEKRIIDNYDEDRNYPWIKGTSKIGVHLRFGTKSVREIVKIGLKSSDNTYLKELIWREFFIHDHSHKTIFFNFTSLHVPRHPVVNRFKYVRSEVIKLIPIKCDVDSRGIVWGDLNRINHTLWKIRRDIIPRFSAVFCDVHKSIIGTGIDHIFIVWRLSYVVYGVVNFTTRTLVCDRASSRSHVLFFISGEIGTYLLPVDTSV